MPSKCCPQTQTLPPTTQDVGEALVSQIAKERLQRRQCFLKQLSNIRFLARQGLALRGDGDESDSNFLQLMNLHQEDDPRLAEWQKRRTDKYTCADMQNEALKVMSLQVLLQICKTKLLK